METHSFVGYVESLTKLGNTPDTIVRKFLAAAKDEGGSGIGIGPDTLYHICFVDFSKLGRVSQMEVNDALGYAKKVLELNINKSVLLMIPPLLSSANMFGLKGEFRRSNPGAENCEQ